MKTKLILLLVLLVQLFCVNPAQAWSEDWDWGSSGGGSGQMIIPLQGDWVLTSPQGWRIHPIYGDRRYHSGADLGGDYGWNVVAAMAGTVSYAGWISGYGNTVIIDHGGGLTSLYGHNQDIVVSTGQVVSQGQLIAHCGSTGNSTGPHCHFEVRVNDKAVDPGLYCPELMTAEMAYDPNHVPETAEGMDDIGGHINFDVNVDFAKPVRELVEAFVDAITAAMGLVKNEIYKLFMVLITADVVLGLAMRSMGADNNDLSQWIFMRLVMYGLFMFLLSNWGDIVGALAMYGFPSLGSMAAGATPEETAKILSDPSMIIQRGVQIIAPIINEALKIKGVTDILFHGLVSVMCLFFGLIFLLCFFIIGIQVIRAYLEFYFVLLFSFTGFMLSGLHQTRKYAANSLNGVFAVSINIMFFCLFSYLLSYSMEHIAVGNFTETRRVEATSGAITSVEDCMARIRVVESYYGNYHCDNHQGYYGAYQCNKNYWDSWCDDYMANRAGGTPLDTDANYKRYDGGPGPYDTENEPTWTTWPWSPANQDTIARYRLEGFFYRYGSWEAACRAWNQGEGGMNNAEAYKYQEMCLNAQGVSSTQTFLNIALLFKLLLLVLLFIFFADRVSKRLMKQFGSPGFRLTNE